jgi:predicted TIM-barrel enzyme
MFSHRCFLHSSNHVPDTAVCKPHNYLPRFDGVIVGMSLKIDGYTWNPVAPDRAARFMDCARELRGKEYTS